MMGQPQMHVPHPELREPTTRGGMLCPCQASPDDRLWPAGGADVMAATTMMSHRRIDVVYTMLLPPRKDRTVNRSEADGCLTLLPSRYPHQRRAMSPSPRVCCVISPLAIFRLAA